MLLLILLTVLNYTLPRFDADSLCVSRYSIPCTDLDSVALWGQGGPIPTAHLIRMKSVRGREGEPDTLQVPDIEAMNTGLWVVTQDRIGNRSCGSNVVLIGSPPLSVPSARPRLKREWFDVTGRRLEHPPTETGIYFLREGHRVRSVVIVH
jgi:hypothetical protein